MVPDPQRDKWIAFVAEVKSDFKHLRDDYTKLEKTNGDLSSTVGNLKTEIAVLKEKVAIYAGLIGGGISVLVTVGKIVLEVILK